MDDYPLAEIVILISDYSTVKLLFCLDLCFLLKYTCILSTNSSVHFAICYNLSIQNYQYQLSQMDPRDALYHAHHAVYILLQRWTLSVIN